MLIYSTCQRLREASGSFGRAFRSVSHLIALVLVNVTLVVLPLCVLTQPNEALGSESSSFVFPLSADTFIGIDEIRPGSVGIGKTVFSGTEVEEFGVEVAGVLYQGSSAHPYILVRVFGEAVERAGGIVDGMSGSPVYIDGRLAGAVSHVYPGANRYAGLVTPIEPMLRLLSYSGEHDRDGSAAVLDAEPIRSPLLVSGMSGRALELVCSTLTGHRYAAVAGATTRASGRVSQLEPGSAISVQLVDGDIEVASIGTVTYVESDEFVAFGHHFEAAGTVGYIASGAEIVCIAESEDGPFKVATSLDPVGRVTQDRFTGLAGVIGPEAETVRVTARVRDTETGESSTYEFSVIDDERFIFSLITAGLLEAFDSTLGRIGEGTATVSMSLSLSTGSTVTRTNTFSDRSDIAMWSLSEISEAVSLISSNESLPVSLTNMSVEAEISPDVRTARIEALETGVGRIEPGGVLKARITLRPYRSSSVVIETEIAIPEDASPGYAQLSVRGGSEVFGAYVGESGSQMPDSDAEPTEFSLSPNGYPDLESQLADLATRPKNTDLVLDLYLPNSVDFEGTVDEGLSSRQPGGRPEPTSFSAVSDDEELRGDEPSDRQALVDSPQRYADYESARPIQVVLPFDYVVYGYDDVGVQVVLPEGAPAEDEVRRWCNFTVGQDFEGADEE